MNDQQNNQSLDENSELRNDPVSHATTPQGQVAGQAATINAGNARINEVKSFFSKDLLQIIKSIFTQPIKGTFSIFNDAGAEAYQQGLILIITTVMFYIIVPYIAAGSEIRSVIGFGAFFKLGLSAGLVLVVISGLSFVVKAVSGKPDFKKELLTGGICGIPMIILLLFISIMIATNKDSFSLMDPESLIRQGIFFAIVLLYLLLMLFNIIQQSFKASGTNDPLSWYLSPLVICIGFYIGVKIASSLFVPSMGGFGNNFGGY
jgi:hypothetical protein